MLSSKGYLQTTPRLWLWLSLASDEWFNFGKNFCSNSLMQNQQSKRGCENWTLIVGVLRSFQHICWLQVCNFNMTYIVALITIYLVFNPNMKLCWFTHYMPEEAEDTRQLFIRTVIVWLNTGILETHDYFVQLHDYHCSAAVPPTPMRPADPIRSMWADDLLGNNLFDTTLHPQGFEAEVNAYLTDVKSVNYMVKYWQLRWWA